MHDTLGHFDDFDCFGIGLIYEAITLEDCDWRLHVYFTRVALATEVELDHGNREELGVATGVDGHRYFGLLLVGCCEVFQAF